MLRRQNHSKKNASLASVQHPLKITSRTLRIEAQHTAPERTPRAYVLPYRKDSENAQNAP
jgi:hypothetical protein